MNVIKNEHGVFIVRKPVPPPLRRAVAEVLRNGKPQQRFLQKSLRTKDATVAKQRAPAILQHFDGVLQRAKALTAERPIRTTLSQTEIDRMADNLCASILADDERWRFSGKEFLTEAEEWLKREGIECKPMFPLGTLPDHGITQEQFRIRKEEAEEVLEWLREALGRGDISEVEDDIELLLLDNAVELDRKGPVYRPKHAPGRYELMLHATVRRAGSIHPER
jgi:hypothetical protein